MRWVSASSRKFAFDKVTTTVTFSAGRVVAFSDGDKFPYVDTCILPDQSINSNYTLVLVRRVDEKKTLGDRLSLTFNSNDFATTSFQATLIDYLTTSFQVLSRASRSSLASPLLHLSRGPPRL